MALLQKNGTYVRSHEWRANNSDRMKKFWREGHGRELNYGPRECMGCGITFTARSTRQKWCSRTCSHIKQLATKHGLEHWEFRDLVERQAGRCAICGKTPTATSLHIDHDHATGRVRGLLCISCNTGLGKLGDSEEALMRAIDYLRGHTDSTAL